MLREGKGARRFNTPVTLTNSERVVDDYGHATYKAAEAVGEVYANVVVMSASKTLMTFQQADVVGLDIELRDPGISFNGICYNGHEVHFSEPIPSERGMILRITGWYQIDR